MKKPKCYKDFDTHILTEQLKIIILKYFILAFKLVAC